MIPYYQDAAVTIYHGCSKDVLRGIATGSVHAIVTDPPYELTQAKRKNPPVYVEGSPYSRHRVGVNGDNRPIGGFMGNTWDGSGIAFDPELWAECLRVLRPGGHLLAFGGTRTYHRMVCAIEDAGFEVRDQIGWVYGSGFPKSLDVSKAIDKAAGAEREVIGERKGGAALKIGGENPRPWHERQAARGGTYDVTTAATDAAKQWEGWGTALKPAWEPICVARKPLDGTVAENVQAHDAGALNIDGCRITGESTIRQKDGGRGQFPHEDDSWTPKSVIVGSENGRWPANLIHDGSEEVVKLFPAEAGAAAPVRKRNGDKFRNTFGAFAGNIDEAGSTFQGDSGSAARFFYCAKASQSERGEGNTHPTVKPLALMRYLVRLVTPKGGIVVDPFLGSGTTGVACKYEGMNFIGIDREAEYCAIAAERCSQPVEVQESLGI